LWSDITTLDKNTTEDYLHPIKRILDIGFDYCFTVMSFDDIVYYIIYK